MRELRHDFRAVYGVSYDSVPTEEAIDLALTLGYGTRYGASKNPDMAWNLEMYQMANVIDLLSIINWRLMRYAGPKQYAPAPTPRPGDAERKAKQQARSRQKAASVAAKLNKTEWEDI